VCLLVDAVLASSIMLGHTCQMTILCCNIESLRYVYVANVDTSVVVHAHCQQ
jgi:hypothetical protein